MYPRIPALSPYRPAWSPPVFRPPPPAPPALGQTVTAAKGAAITILLIPTAVAGVVSYVGFRTGVRDKNLPQVLGYAVGLLGGVAALGGLLAMLGIAVLPVPTLQPAPAEVAKAA